MAYFIILLYYNTNRKYLGMWSLTWIYATCSRNCSQCLLQNITFAIIHKGSNEKPILNCDRLLSFCSQAWWRISLNLMRWCNFWGVLNWSGLKCCTVSLVTFIFIFLDRLTISNNLIHQLLYFLPFLSIILRSWIWNFT